MLTYLKSNKFSFFKGKRLVFNIDVSKVTQGIETAVAPDKAFATTGLDETAVLWNESAKKGEVKKFLDGVVGKVLNAIPKNLLFTTAIANYAEYGDDAAAETADAVKIVLNGITIPKNSEWQDVSGLALVGKLTIPNVLSLAIGKSKDKYGAKKACNTFEQERLHRKEVLDAAKEIADYNNQLINNMQMIAETCVQQKQQERFEAAKKAYIGKRVKELFPSPMNGEIDSDLEKKRQLATQYVDGLLMRAELKLGTEIGPELKKHYDKVSTAVKREFINNFFEKDTSKRTNYQSDKLEKVKNQNVAPEIKAYVEGLIDAGYTGKNSLQDRRAARKWIQSKINSLPEDQRNELSSVKGVLSTVYIEIKEEAQKWTNPKLTDKDKEVYKVAEEISDPIKKEEAQKVANKAKTDYEKAAKIMKEDPKVSAFFEQRMAEAYKLYAGKPNFESNMATYRSIMLYQIAASQEKKGTKMVVNMEKLDASIKPTTMIAGAEKIGVGRDKLPKGVRGAKNMPPGTGDFALKLVKRLGRNVEVGTVISFVFKGRHFYGIIPKLGDFNILEYPKNYSPPKNKGKKNEEEPQSSSLLSNIS